jgi:uncharacterized protein
MPAVNLTRQTWLATTVRTASRFGTRLVGLLGRGRLGPEEALWLVPCRAIHTLGMRFPIDVVFLDRGGLVVATLENVRPWRLSPIVRKAHSVLELRAGTLRKSATRVGDSIELSAADDVTLDDLRDDPLAGGPGDHAPRSSSSAGVPPAER